MRSRPEHTGRLNFYAALQFKDREELHDNIVTFYEFQVYTGTRKE
jgi:hypothetical protein